MSTGMSTTNPQDRDNRQHSPCVQGAETSMHEPDRTVNTIVRDIPGTIVVARLCTTFKGVTRAPQRALDRRHALKKYCGMITRALQLHETMVALRNGAIVRALELPNNDAIIYFKVAWGSPAGAVEQLPMLRTEAYQQMKWRLFR